jgi:hypothetical protein
MQTDGYAQHLHHSLHKERTIKECQFLKLLTNIIDQLRVFG